MAHFVQVAGWCLLAFSFTLPSSALAAKVEMQGVSLDPDEEIRLGNVACVGPLDVGASRITANEYGATVECSSHAAYRGHPLFAETDCERRDGRWVCDPLRYGIRMPNREGPNRIILTGATPKEGVEIVRFLDELPPYAGNRIDSKLTREIVRIWRLDGNEFRVHAGFVGRLLSIQRHCELTECVHSITSFGLIDY